MVDYQAAMNYGTFGVSKRLAKDIYSVLDMSFIA